MRANCPVERFTKIEIGERDGWLCGICQDRGHLVDPSRRRPDPRSPSIDHIVPVIAGGTHTGASREYVAAVARYDAEIGGLH
jgi:hypothetical protein